jgi:hypothetical protein
MASDQATLHDSQAVVDIRAAHALYKNMRQDNLRAEMSESGDVLPGLWKGVETWEENV